MNPLKQGLKPVVVYSESSVVLLVKEVNPLKQGLKLFPSKFVDNFTS